jgi:hypothetical protein
VERKAADLSLPAANEVVMGSQCVYPMGGVDKMAVEIQLRRGGEEEK